MTSDMQSPFGPSHVFTCPLVEEDEAGSVVQIGLEGKFLLIDLSDHALDYLRDYDPVIDPSANIVPYSSTRPEAIVQVDAVIDLIRAWLQQAGAHQRMDFYSAREELPEVEPSGKTSAKPAAKKTAQKKITTASLAETVGALAEQVRLIAAQQQEILDGRPLTPVIPVEGHAVGGPSMPSALPPVASLMTAPPAPNIAKVAKLMGPPPKSKASTLKLVPGVGEELPIQANVDNPGNDDVARALVQQSQALTALVSHLTTGDPLMELSNTSGSSQGVGTRGVARRERLQQELASGSSNFFIQVQQQIFRKMNPAMPLPRTDADLAAAGPSMCSYLERFGGYKGKAELGMIMWLVAHAMDSASVGDMHKAKEFLALLAASVEQAASHSNWTIAYLLTLLEEPPSQLFCERTHPVSALGKPFTPLVPGQWSAVALAYLKEVDLLSSKKTETRPGKPNPKQDDPSGPPSPKRKPKFPKKPKASSDASP